MGSAGGDGSRLGGHYGGYGGRGSVGFSGISDGAGAGVDLGGGSVGDAFGWCWV